MTMKVMISFSFEQNYLFWDILVISCLRSYVPVFNRLQGVQLPSNYNVKNCLHHVNLMCGIFAYMGHKPIPILTVLKVLQILENEQEPNEKSPVGGHGAGIAYLNKKGKLTFAKVAKTKRSPVKDLTSQLEATTISSSLILGHVRRASPQFQDTIECKEFAQPYKPQCSPDFNLVSAHNGFLQNYNELRNKLTQPHHFESRKIKLNDSEVPAHLYEELLTQKKDPTRAAHALYEQIEGNNTLVILSTNKTGIEAHLQAIQKGRTRGLVIWTNQRGEVIICSREKPVQENLHKFLVENNYQKIVNITRNDSTRLETHFTLNPPTNTHEP